MLLLGGGQLHRRSPALAVVEGELQAELQVVPLGAECYDGSDTQAPRKQLVRADVLDWGARCEAPKLARYPKRLAAASP